MEIVIAFVVLWIAVKILPDSIWESPVGKAIYGIALVLFLLVMAAMCMGSPGGWEARWG